MLLPLPWFCQHCGLFRLTLYAARDATVVLLVGGEHCGNTTARSTHQGPRLARLVRLQPYLAAAVQAGIRVADLSWRAEIGVQGFDRLALGTVVVSQRRQVLHMNRVARELIDARDTFVLRAGELHTIRPGDDACLGARIELAMSGTEAPAEAARSSMMLSRRTSPHPYQVSIEPLRLERSMLALEWPSALIVVGDPDRRPLLASRQLGALFGLTPREAEIAAGLVSGETADTLASSLALSRNTVRLHIEHLLRKMGCRRQSDLVRVVLHSPAAWTEATSFQAPVSKNLSEQHETPAGQESEHLPAIDGLDSVLS